MAELLLAGVVSRYLFYLRTIRRLERRAERVCPVCGYTGKFRAYGYPPRIDARCTNCKSLERHRLFFLCNERLGLFEGRQSVLHFAPEASISAIVAAKVRRYQTADIVPGRAELHLDIEGMDLPDASFDVLIANHVLEHVDDAKALKEIFRVLVPGGRFIAMVPVVEGWETTYENPSVRTPEERQLHFGQWDHIRYYGRDFRDRVRQAGFALEEFGATGAECVKYALERGDRVFIAQKPL